MKASARFLLFFLLLSTAVACDRTRASLDAPTPEASAPSSQLAQNPTQSKNIVRTEPFSPTPIRINLSDLPKPFATESASKSPQVVPIPDNPTLHVPPGFVVNVFADGLDAPRWLALTPREPVQ